MKYKLILCSISAMLATVCTGCASTIHPFGDDYLTITGTPEGYDSFFDGVDAIAQSAKGNPHEATNAARHKHDKELTKRAALTVSLGKGDSHE